MEFATEPFDLPRRDVIDAHAMFDTPTYRWLPARGKITSSFLMFYTQSPDGFSQIDDITLDDGRLTISDRKNAKTIVLIASKGL
jgi:hypothetical protein